MSRSHQPRPPCWQDFHQSTTSTAALRFQPAASHQHRHASRPCLCIRRTLSGRHNQTYRLNLNRAWSATSASKLTRMKRDGDCSGNGGREGDEWTDRSSVATWRRGEEQDKNLGWHHRRRWLTYIRVPQTCDTISFFVFKTSENIFVHDYYTTIVI